MKIQAVVLAMLLGAARLLAERREQIPGTVKFMFQPAEEIGGGRVTPPPGMRAPTDAHGNPRPELAPPLPAWVKTLNNILLRLGEEAKLAVEQIAMVVFSAE